MGHETRIQRVAFIGWLVWCLVLGGFQEIGASPVSARPLNVSTTVLFYMNGDNDLTDEVLSTVDRMERVGSSDGLNIVALVDGHPTGVSRFGKKWVGTRLLHILPDDHTAQINSTVLADWGEQDLGDPETLTRFIRVALERFPADRYIFCTFAHGKGVIDTGNLTGNPTGKSLFISTDATSETIMPLNAFEDALAAGLDGRRFSLMVLFSCLSGMVEIAHALGDVTDYLIASEDEIRLVNDPPGTHQLRGISFEDLLLRLKMDPSISAVALGRSIVERYLTPYTQPVSIIGPSGHNVLCRYSAGLALIDCRKIDGLAVALDDLAAQLIEDLKHPDLVIPTLSGIQASITKTQSYKSFLNLEYYDLSGWLDRLAQVTTSDLIHQKCRRIAGILKSEVILFERHTQDTESGGMAIFFSHHLVPENIYQAHQAMYRRTRFGRNTRWHEFIATYRYQMHRHNMELVMYQARQAHRFGDTEQFQRLSKHAFRLLHRRIQEGRRERVEEHLAFFYTLPPGVLPPQLSEDLNTLIHYSGGTLHLSE